MSDQGHASEANAAIRMEQGSKGLDEIFRSEIETQRSLNNLTAVDEIGKLHDVVIQNITAERLYTTDEAHRIRSLINGFIGSNYSDGSMESIVEFISHMSESTPEVDE